MSTASNGCESNVYIWVQGSIRGCACFVYGANRNAIDYLRQHFRVKNDTSDGIHIEAPPTIVINSLRACNYQIANTASLETFNLLWTLQPKTLS